MTSLAKRIERDVHKNGCVSADSTEALQRSDIDESGALALVVDYMKGSYSPLAPEKEAGRPTNKATDAEAVEAIRVLLVQFRLDSELPEWSSEMMRELISVCKLLTPEIGLILPTALLEVLGDYCVVLNDSVLVFIRSLCNALRIDKALPSDGQLAGLSFDDDLSAAQTYLLLWLGKPVASHGNIIRVIRSLARSDQLEAAVRELGFLDDLDSHVVLEAVADADIKPKSAEFLRAYLADRSG